MRVGAVLVSRWRIARNTLVPGRGRRSARRASATWLGIVLAFTLAFVAYAALRALFGSLEATGVGAERAGAVLGLLFGAASAGLLVFDLHYATSALLLDPDLELFRRAPASPASLFALKLVDAFPRTVTLLGALALPAAVAYASAYPLAPWGWVALPVELLLLWAIPLGLGVALAMELARLVPPARAREALSLLSTLALTLLWIGSSFLLPRLAQPGDPLADRLGTLAIGSRAPWSPAQWAADAFAAAARGEPAVAARGLVSLGLAAAAALGIGAWSAARNLEILQSRLAAPGTRRRRRPSRRLSPAAGTHPAAGPAGIPSPALRQIGAILRLEARLLSRDWTVLGDVLTAALLWTLLPLLSLPALDAPAPLLVRAMLVTLGVSLGYEIAARSIPFERHAAAWTALAPIAPGRAIAARLSGVGLLAVALLAAAGVSLQAAFDLAAREWLGILALALPALGLSLCLGLWSGSRFGDPDWTNPRAMLTLAGRSLAAVLLIGQAVFWLAFAWAAGSDAARGLPGLPIWGPAVVALLLAPLPIRAVRIRPAIH